MYFKLTLLKVVTIINNTKLAMRVSIASLVPDTSEFVKKVFEWQFFIFFSTVGQPVK